MNFVYPGLVIVLLLVARLNLDPLNLSVWLERSSTEFLHLHTLFFLVFLVSLIWLHRDYKPFIATNSDWFLLALFIVSLFLFFTPWSTGRGKCSLELSFYFLYFDNFKTLTVSVLRSYFVSLAFENDILKLDSARAGNWLWLACWLENLVENRVRCFDE